MNDDWGKALGSDEDKPMVTKMSTKTKNTTMALVYHFNKSIEYPMNFEINALALSKNFKNLRDSGVSYTDLYNMIDRFFYEIKQKPLPKDVTTWAAFIKRRDDLLKWVTTNSTDSDVSEWK